MSERFDLMVIGGGPAGLAAAVVLWTPLSILGFLAGLLSLFPATIWARQ